MRHVEETKGRAVSPSFARRYFAVHLCCELGAAQSPPSHHYVQVQMPSVASQGRVLLFLTKAVHQQPALTAFEDGPLDNQAVAALELGSTPANALVDVDVDAQAYPGKFATITAG